MSDAIPVHCRHCNEALDVYQPWEDRFCSEECHDTENRMLRRRVTGFDCNNTDSPGGDPSPF